ncbi:MAG: hypothetical protein M1839_000928 [Geoglossum umbratile]|nr:MAG: hypothetical protein M1839_000928 [Geoglossum umbratile]
MEVATILSCANTGFKLSMTLFSFAQAIGSAGKEILQTGKDISLFSAVLRELGVTLQRAQKAGLVSETAFETTAKIKDECTSIFEELEAIIEKSTTTTNVHVVKMRSDEVEELDRESVEVSWGNRFLHLFRKSQIQEQKRALESLKSSLLTMLVVMSFAENNVLLATELNSDTSLGSIKQGQYNVEEQLAMESLVLANQAATADFRKHSGTNTLLGRLNTNVEGGSITTYGVVEDLSRSRGIHAGEQISVNPALQQPVTNINILPPSAGATKLGHTHQPEPLASAINPPKPDWKYPIPFGLRSNGDGKSEAKHLNVIAPSLSQSLLSGSVGPPTPNYPQAELPAGIPPYAPPEYPLSYLPAASLGKPKAKPENQKTVQPTSSQAVDLLLQSWTVQKEPQVEKSPPKGDPGEQEGDRMHLAKENGNTTEPGHDYGHSTIDLFPRRKPRPY